MKNKFVVLLLIYVILFMTGCTQNNQVLYKSTKHIEHSRMKQNYYLIAENVTVEASNRFFGYVPLTLMPFSPDDRINALSLELLKKYNGDVLTDVKVETGWLVTLYYNTYTYYLTANVWQRKEK